MENENDQEFCSAIVKIFNELAKTTSEVDIGELNRIVRLLICYLGKVLDRKENLNL